MKLSYKRHLNGHLLNYPKKDVKGIPSDMNGAQVDHIVSKSAERYLGIDDKWVFK